MKKLLLLLMFPVLLLLSGCEDKVNPKTLNGMWVVYDSSHPSAIGARFSFLEGGRFVVQDVMNFSSTMWLYEISDNELRCYFIKNKVKGNLDKLFLASLDSGTLFLQEQERGTCSFWVKLKKKED